MEGQVVERNPEDNFTLIEGIPFCGDIPDDIEGIFEVRKELFGEAFPGLVMQANAMCRARSGNFHQADMPAMPVKVLQKESMLGVEPGFVVGGDVYTYRDLPKKIVTYITEKFLEKDSFFVWIE